MVHHIDRNRKNNNINNLLLISNHSDHMKIHHKNKDIDLRVDKSNRICNICNITEDKITNKKYSWYIDLNGWLCKLCYSMINYYNNRFNKND